MAAPARATRPGGRAARIRSVVHDAVVAELCEHGFDALTVDGVAGRAGVHRTTVYRRWRDVGGLLSDVLDEATGAAWEAPDTGAFETDLVAINHELHAALSGGSPVALALIAASFRSDEAAMALRAFWTDRVERSAAVVRRAAERGEIAAGVDPRQVVLAATGPLFYGIVLMREEMAAPTAADYARITARAFRRDI